MKYQRIIRVTGMVLLLCLPASSGRAQSSKIKSLSTISSGMSVGKSSATRSFNAYSAGAGSYGNLYSAPQGGGALRSSIRQLNDRGGRTGGNPASAFGGTMPAGVQFGKSTKTIAPGALGSSALGGGDAPPPTVGGAAPVLAGSGATPSATKVHSAVADAEALATFPLPAESSGRAYAAAVASPRNSDAQDEDDETLKTLAPKTGESFHYRRLIREGEDAFRKEDYNKAARSFETAAEISSQSSESQLSLMHVHFATARNEYNMPSLYLQRVLREVPELPLLPVHPRDFYGNAGQFVKDVIRLEEYAQADPDDANAQLVLAYMKWREKQPDQAAAALRRAWEHRKNNEELADAIQTFWKGLVHAGAVSGTLEETSSSPDMESLPMMPVIPPAEAPSEDE
ncbi:MAG: hypothetical protein JW849_05185 [Phycisphaerae bacterium]|nr:hypothetical protein [Phycisphaerae bacterium]